MSDYILCKDEKVFREVEAYFVSIGYLWWSGKNRLAIEKVFPLVIEHQYFHEKDNHVTVGGRLSYGNLHDILYGATINAKAFLRKKKLERINKLNEGRR